MASRICQANWHHVEQLEKLEKVYYECWQIKKILAHAHNVKLELD